MDIRDLKGRTALVTGAASGIGRESALAFARRGARLVVCDLNEAALAETAAAIEALGVPVFARRLDVADREAMRAFAAEVQREIGALDLLMANAGVGLGGGFLHTSLEDWDWILGINLLGVIHTCHFFLPPMVERRSGHVIIVSSAAGFMASAALSAYATTKFAVRGLAEALHDELRSQGIGVTAVCPGIIDTGITRSTRLVGPMNSESMRKQMVEGYRRRGYTPERVARNILKAVQKDRLIAPISPEAWAMVYLKRFTPGLLRWLSALAAARQMPKASGH